MLGFEELDSLENAYLVLTDHYYVFWFLFAGVALCWRYEDVFFYARNTVGGKQTIILFHTKRLSFHSGVGTVNG